jgi:hypothetical protein
LGGKGGGKSELMRAWLVSGNPHLSDRDERGNDISWNRTYTEHPYYRGLILRKNEGDLADFIKRAARMWKSLAGEYKNGRFEFPSGAVIDVGHMKDQTAWMKYVGIEYVRIAIDEVGLIKDYSLFEELRSTMRTPYPELRCQIMVASNAGGPGTSWLIERYMKARDTDGNIIPHDNVITEEYMHPFTGEKRFRTRIWMFSTIQDNPIYTKSDYAITLMSLSDPKLRRAYFEGHWDALFGSYFCFKKGTEILTDQGWMDITSVVKGQPVATLSPSMEMSFEPCTMTKSFPFLGEMREFNGKSLRFSVTPNHRMYSRLSGKNEYAMIPVDDLPSSSEYLRAAAIYRGTSPEEIIIKDDSILSKWVKLACIVCGSLYLAKAHRLRHRRRTTCSRPCSYVARVAYRGHKSEFAPTVVGHIDSIDWHRFDPGDWAELLGWYITEGSIERRKGVVIGFTISQYEAVNRAKCQRIATLLRRMGLSFTRDDMRFRVHSTALGKVLAHLGTSRSKYIPREVVNYKKDHLERLFEALMLGDGCPSTNCQGAYEYFTVSKRLADDIQELCARLGRICFIGRRPSKNPKHADGYYLHIRRPGKLTSHVRKTDIVSVPYEGLVACVTVEPYHTVLVRYEGSAMWCGNSDLFRPDGPIKVNNEPPNANHVLKPMLAGTEKRYPIEIKPWHHITMGGDWGYAHEAAFLWARQLPDKRVVIYREFVADHTSPVRLGFEIAQKSLKELEGLPSHSFTLWLSHDAFRNDRGERSTAELIAAGISKVLGPKAVHLPDLMIRNLRESFAMESFNRYTAEQQQEAIDQILLQRRTGITIRIAEKTGVIGWQHCRELMQWESFGEPNTQRDPEFARKLLHENPKAFEAYVESFRDIPVEVRPRLQIYDCCPRLITAIPRALHEDGTENVDKAHFIGKDLIDAFSYLVSGLMDEAPAEPFEAFRERRLEESSRYYGSDLTTNDLCRIHESIEGEWKDMQQDFSPVTPPRMARLGRLMRQGKIRPEQNIDRILGIEHYG